MGDRLGIPGAVSFSFLSVGRRSTFAPCDRWGREPARSRTRSDRSRILADRPKVDSRTVYRANPALSRKAGGPVGSLSIRPKVDSCTVSRANPTCLAVRSESRTARASLRLEQASILGLLAVRSKCSSCPDQLKIGAKQGTLDLVCRRN